MAGQMQHIPSIPRLHNIGQTLPGRTVLHDGQFHLPLLACHDLAYKRSQLIPLAPQRGICQPV